MKLIRRGRIWVVIGVLLGGVIYSAFSLTLATPLVYASSCNCPEESQEAALFCDAHGGVANFFCPIDCSGGPCVVGVCSDNTVFIEVCSGT